MTLSTSVHKKAIVGFVQDVGTLLTGGTWRKKCRHVRMAGLLLWFPHKMMKIELALVREE